MLLRSDHYSIRFPTTSYNAYCEAVSLTRLVEAEIVSPYRGILINTGMGNLTMPLIVALGKQAIPNGQVGRRTASGASIKG